MIEFLVTFGSLPVNFRLILDYRKLAGNVLFSNENYKTHISCRISHFPDRNVGILWSIWTAIAMELDENHKFLLNWGVYIYIFLERSI